MTKKECSWGETSNSEEIANVHPNNSRFYDSEKPIRVDAKQNREKILEAALKIFTEKGMAIPIGEIAHKAGVGIGTVYRHFPSKEALLEAIYIIYKQQLTEDAKSLTNNSDPGKAFFDFFSNTMKDGFNNKALKDAFKSLTFTRTANAGVVQDFKSAFANLLAKAQQSKAVREDIGINDIITLMMGLLQAIDQRKGDLDISRFNKLISIVSDGLRYKE
ncbi:TetR/AcrR family transcriptional regulator [Clostridium estertheticum]|uniref:TetR/AcrR family transcriptional regulator n=1 Tax=Clostridium estertheticum TaxID=238834 RepID=UPI001C7D6C1A|nr:TetR/AcrR family transcriptional regulator [Clostridium estertheticum]MBX4271694.1 TetR/AcrR family transcriptional regulator [Clostridium estertheticum]WLC78868.1 TetR/AcrR family transcriptional regulator [Clostridium estertheticum]